MVNKLACTPTSVYNRPNPCSFMVTVLVTRGVSDSGKRDRTPEPAGGSDGQMSARKIGQVLSGWWWPLSSDRCRWVPILDLPLHDCRQVARHGARTASHGQPRGGTRRGESATQTASCRAGPNRGSI